MGENLDRMRKAAQQGPSPPTPPPNGRRQRGDDKPAPPAKYRHRCGHAFTEFEISQHDCVSCHRGNQRRRARETGLRREGRWVGRLPVGSVKTLTWDGAAWTGVMTVPGRAEPFRATADSEKKCYHALHDAFAAWAATQDTAPGG